MWPILLGDLNITLKSGSMSDLLNEIRTRDLANMFSNVNHLLA